MSDLWDQALRYAAWGWYVFPVLPFDRNGRCACGEADCDRVGKHPAAKWGKGSSRDPKQIERWRRQFPNGGLGVSCGPSKLVVVDIDGPNSEAELTAIFNGREPPRTLQVKTGRGRHLYFTGESRNISREGDAIDIRAAGGYVVVPPSPHISGQAYAWDSITLPAPLPPEISAWRESLGGSSKKKNKRALEVTAPAYARGSAPLAARAILLVTDRSEVLQALYTIPASCGREPWWKVGMALHATAWPDAFEIWRAWSETCPDKYKPDNTAYVWSTFKPGETQLGTLFFFARQYGWVRAPQAARPLGAAATPTGAVAAIEQKPSNTNGVHANPALLPPEPPTSPLIEFNKRFAAIGDIGGKCLILSWVPSKVDDTVSVPSFQTCKSFAERYANQYVMVSQEPKQAGSYWLKWPARRSFEGIDLAPSGPPVLPGNILNLWSGFAITPAPGSWDLMRRHICEVLAAGDQEGAQYILRFAAWAVQHPGERAEVALVFRGGKGSGKGTFANALRRIFGQHGLQIFNSKHLVGAFNGHLRSCLLLFADEAFWAGDKQGESVLKGMLTEQALMIEQKGVDAAPWKNRLHVIMSANADWIVPASHDERRFACFNVSDARIGDKRYFLQLYAEIENGGLTAMLHDLQTLPLGDWHPREVVATEALREQKARSMGALDAWWESLLQDGVLPFTMFKSTTRAKATHILEHARQLAARVQDINPIALGRYLGKIGCDAFHERDGAYWVFPALSEARLAFARKYRGWAWDTNFSAWQDRHETKVSQPSQSITTN